jgi:hypothetical protein
MNNGCLALSGLGKSSYQAALHQKTSRSRWRMATLGAHLGGLTASRAGGRAVVLAYPQSSLCNAHTTWQGMRQTYPSGW